MKMIWCGLKIKENYQVLVNQFHGNFRSKTLGCRKIMSVYRDVKWCFNASWGLKGLISRAHFTQVIDVSLRSSTCWRSLSHKYLQEIWHLCPYHRPSRMCNISHLNNKLIFILTGTLKSVIQSHKQIKIPLNLTYVKGRRCPTLCG